MLGGSLWWLEMLMPRETKRPGVPNLACLSAMCGCFVFAHEGTVHSSWSDIEELSHFFVFYQLPAVSSCTVFMTYDHLIRRIKTLYSSQHKGFIPTLPPLSAAPHLVQPWGALEP